MGSCVKPCKQQKQIHPLQRHTGLPIQIATSNLHDKTRNMSADNTAGDRWLGICTLLLRAVSLCFVYFAIQYWMKIVGIQTGQFNRFDTMPEHWRIAVSVLAVLYPVAALGLWGLFSWGVVLWAAAIAIEVSMFVGFPHLFGEAPLLVLFHAAAFSLYIVIRLAIFIISRREAGSAEHGK